MEYAIIFLPLISSFLSAFFGRKIGDKYSPILSSSLIGISAVFSLIIFYKVLTQDYSSNNLIFNWINSGNFLVNWSIYIDTLTSIMLVVVTLISSIIHFYSIGYMSHDPHKPRFMAYLSLFTFSMLMLVTADNFIQLFFGWEGVGLCSYLLIGFWYKKPAANAAAIKAFLVNRVGDFGLAIGIFLIFFFYGTVNFNEVFQETPSLTNKELIFLGIKFNLITYFTQMNIADHTIMCDCVHTRDCDYHVITTNTTVDPNHYSMFVKLLIAADQKAERLSHDSSSFNKKLKQINNQYAQIQLSSNSVLATKIKPSFSQPLANIPPHQFVLIRLVQH